MGDVAKQEEEVPRDEQPFAKCAFGNERRRLARMFTNYFDRTDSTSGYVANLNGEWGTGKTFFVTEWSKLLKTENYGVVFIDAWKSDYLEDPLSIVVAEVLQQLTTQLKTNFEVHNTQELTSGILRTSGGLIKAFLPVLTKAVGKKFLGDETVDLLTEFIGGTKDFLGQDSPKTLSSRLGEFGELAFATHQRHCQFASDFKKELQKLIDLTAETSRKGKVYIFIDELDRCRPTYAIEMLETIKHLFDINNLVFIISTDTAQLEHSIKAVYGNGFDSYEYLHRFFKQRITLPKPDYYQLLKIKNAFKNVDFSSHHFYPKIDSADKLRALVALQAATNEIEIRRLESIYSQIELFLSNMHPEPRLIINTIFLVASVFTINICSTLEQDPKKSLTASKASPVGKTSITVNDICICENISTLSAILFHELALDLIDDFKQIKNHNINNVKLKRLNLATPENRVAEIFIQELKNGKSHNYALEIHSEAETRTSKIVPDTELFKMIKKLEINSQFISTPSRKNIS